MRSFHSVQAVADPSRSRRGPPGGKGTYGLLTPSREGETVPLGEAERLHVPEIKWAADPDLGTAARFGQTYWFIRRVKIGLLMPFERTQSACPM